LTLLEAEPAYPPYIKVKEHIVAGQDGCADSTMTLSWGEGMDGIQLSWTSDTSSAFGSAALHPATPPSQNPATCVGYACPCSTDSDCCSGLYCRQENGRCCDPDFCDFQGWECEQTTAGTGSVEIHAAQCPAGYSGSDYYNDCHGNGESGVVFSVSNADGSSQQVTSQIEASPGPGIARANGLNLGVFSVAEPYADSGEPVYVFCSPDQGATAYVDQYSTASEGVSITLDAGTALVCDWYSLS
jgi:hypothetical protein